MGWFRAELAKECNYKVVRLASRTGLSLRQFERRFQSSFGFSPQHWLEEQRMAKALLLLRQNRPVKAIAFELGFKRPDHFCRSFRRHFGLSPTEFLLSDPTGLAGPRVETGAANGRAARSLASWAQRKAPEIQHALPLSLGAKSAGISYGLS